MLRLGSLLNSKIGFPRILSTVPTATERILMVRNFCERGPQKNSINSVIDEVKKGLNKLQSEIVQCLNAAEKQKKFGNVTEINELRDGNNKMKAELQNKFDILQKRMDEKHECLFQQLEKLKIAILTAGQIYEIELAKFDSNAYKWNVKDCGRELTILEDGFVAHYTGKNGVNSCVRATCPVPAFTLSDKNKTTVAFYFEVEYLKKQSMFGLGIGFCTQQFPLEGRNLGWHWVDSIRISANGRIFAGRNDFTQYKPDSNFIAEDVIGAGIIHSPSNSSMQCFSTCNGKLLGKADLPKIFETLRLFPAITLCHDGDKIRANFGNNEWRFKQFDQLLKQQE